MFSCSNLLLEVLSVKKSKSYRRLEKLFSEVILLGMNKNRYKNCHKINSHKNEDYSFE